MLTSSLVLSDRQVEDNFKLGVRSVSEAVRSMPDTIFNTVDGMVDGIYRRIVGPPHRRLNTSADYTHRGSLDLEVRKCFSSS